MMTQATPPTDILFKRVLIKLSGEALMGDKQFGIDPVVAKHMATEVANAKEAGAEICIVIGGGNIFRGVQASAGGMERASADYMGMLATVMNALALENAFEQIGAQARVLSAIPMPTVCEPYVRPRAIGHLEKGRIVIFAAGTGNPYFTTDTAAALRAAEMNCSAMIKATKVDGVYSDDPKTNPKAERYDTLSYSDVLARDLKVMDGAAIALARDNNIPIIVCSIWEEGNLSGVLKGTAKSTIVQ